MLGMEEILKYRDLFPVTQNFIYFNHAGVAPISRPVADAIRQWSHEALHLGYTAGDLWRDKVESIRKKAALLIGASPEEIAFVRNTSHGLSLIARGLKWKEGDEVILSEAEFPSNVYPWMALEPQGVRIKKIPCEGGALKIDRLPSLITPRTRVVSLSSVQYGNGYRLPLAEIGKFCRERGIYFIVDAIQSLGAFELDVVRDSVDFLSADAHKWMLGPEGIGLFYLRKALIAEIEPALLGWGSVMDPFDFDRLHFTLRPTAQRFEEGSPNTASIFALEAAIDLLLEVGLQRIEERIFHLTDLLIDGLKSLNLVLTHCLQKENRSGVVTFCLPNDQKSEELGRLEKYIFSRKIFASLRRGSLRLSPHFYNSDEEVKTFLGEVERFLDATPPRRRAVSFLEKNDEIVMEKRNEL